MFVKQFLTGGDRNFGYLVADESTKLTVIIDPSYSPKLIYDFAKDNGSEIRYIFNTHNHFDHTNGNNVIMKSEVKHHRDGAVSFYCQDPDGNHVQFIYHPPLCGQ